jgi:hypothetical protein
MPYPLLFSLIGTLTGLVIVFTGSNIFQFTLVLLVGAFSLTWGKLTNPNLVKSMIGITIVLVGLTLWGYIQFYLNRSHEFRRELMPFYFIGLIQITIISVAFIQSWKSTKPHYSYSDLFENAWNNHFFILFAGLLTGGFLLVLLLGTALFDSIGIKISKIIWQDEVITVLAGALIGAGIGISRDFDSLIFKIRSVFFAIFRIMAYLAAVIAILFAISLPFTYTELFQNKSTSIILLSLVAVSILLLNTLVDKGSSKLPKWSNWIFSLQITLLPILALLSVYAISIRIIQYGLMPNRVIAISLALLLSLYGMSYLYQLLKHRGHWSKGLIKTNPVLALMWLALLIGLLSPILDPTRLSVNNQLQRLKTNQVKINQFDFYALEHRLGKPGKEEIKEIKTWKDHPQFALIQQRTANIKQPNNYRKPSRKLESSIEIIGESSDLLKELQDKQKNRCFKPAACFIKLMNVSSTNNRNPEAMIFKFSKERNNKYRFSGTLHKYNNWWSTAKYYKSEKKVTKKEMADMIDTLKQDQQKLIAPVYQDVEVGGVKLRQ